MKRIIFILLILAFCMSCAKPYVGQEVPAYSDSWCSCETMLVTACNIESESFDFNFTVSKQISADTGEIECKIVGTAIWNGAAESITSSEDTFNLLLAYGRVVIDSIPFSLNSTSLTNKEIPFKKTFTTRPFDAVAISWKMSIHNQLE